jgi:hypothetical protein
VWSGVNEPDESYTTYRYSDNNDDRIKPKTIRKRVDGRFYGIQYDKKGKVVGFHLAYWNKIYQRHYGKSAMVFPAHLEVNGYPYYSKGHKLEWQYELSQGTYYKWKRVPIGWLRVKVDEPPGWYTRFGGIIHRNPPIMYKGVRGMY